MANINRRKVLKGISVTGAAAIAPFSLHAAKPLKAQQNLAFYVDAKHGQFKNSTSNEIINKSNQPVVLSAKEPVAYKNSNGQNVTLYINTADESYTLQPGERLQIYAKATMINSPEKMNLQNKLVGNAISIV